MLLIADQTQQIASILYPGKGAVAPAGADASSFSSISDTRETSFLESFQRILDEERQAARSGARQDSSSEAQQPYSDRPAAVPEKGGTGSEMPRENGRAETDAKETPHGLKGGARSGAPSGAHSGARSGESSDIRSHVNEKTRATAKKGISRGPVVLARRDGDTTPSALLPGNTKRATIIRGAADSDARDGKRAVGIEQAGGSQGARKDDRPAPEPKIAAEENATTVIWANNVGEATPAASASDAENQNGGRKLHQGKTAERTVARLGADSSLGKESKTTVEIMDNRQMTQAGEKTGPGQRHQSFGRQATQADGATARAEARAEAATAGRKTYSGEPSAQDIEGAARPSEQRIAGDGAASNSNELNGGETRTIEVHYSKPLSSSGQPGYLNGPRSPFSPQLGETINTQIVRQTGIILKNNNRGEIRLVLKPEQLGKLRIRIQLDDNRLTGRIFVTNAIVKEALDNDLESLYRAFKQNGFDAEEFEVLVDRRQGDQSNRRDADRDNDDEAFRAMGATSRAKSLKHLHDAVPILEEIDQYTDQINVVI